jgi:hypothetical protein
MANTKNSDDHNDRAKAFAEVTNNMANVENIGTADLQAFALLSR